MRNRGHVIAVCVPAVVLLVLATGCGPGAQDEAVPKAEKMVRTTASADAGAAFETGLAMVDSLRFTDAREHFQKAVELDPDFAWAHLMVANTSPTASEFWTALAEAESRTGTASEGERLFIEAVSAGVNAQPDRQLELLQKLVDLHPDVPRVRVAFGTYFFGRQDWEKAIVEYRKATTLDPDFSPAYNQLGYALRFTGDMEGAEHAFRTYVDLIPNEPNPYDSLAELLMKLGRHEESIASYEQALEQNPHFIASLIGIGNNQIMLGDGDAARATFTRLETNARTDGERRTACTWTALAHLHDDHHAAALAEIDRRQQIAIETDDRPSIAGDLAFKGNILLDAGRLDEAEASYSAAIEMLESSNAPDDVKENARRARMFNDGRVELARGNVDEAASIADTYLEAALAHGVAFQIWQAHELAGMVALQRNDPQTAIAELDQANQQDPRVMYLKAKAMLAAGDQAGAREMALKSAQFNGLSGTWPYVRAEAMVLAGM